MLPLALPPRTGPGGMLGSEALDGKLGTVPLEARIVVPPKNAIQVFLGALFRRGQPGILGA